MVERSLIRSECFKNKKGLFIIKFKIEVLLTRSISSYKAYLRLCQSEGFSDKRNEFFVGLPISRRSFYFYFLSVIKDFIPTGFSGTGLDVESKECPIFIRFNHKLKKGPKAPC